MLDYIILYSPILYDTIAYIDNEIIRNLLVVVASSGSLVIPVHNASTEVAVIVVALLRELFNGALRL